MKKGTQTSVTQLPKCNFCSDEARYDGKTNMGPWAYMCRHHFVLFGSGLGTGLGQQLMLEESVPVSAQRDLAGRPISFSQWERAVDRIVVAKVGVSSSELEDWASRDCYDAGMTPAEAAQECLEGSDLYNMFFGQE